jgi:hypothetical protein
MLADADEECGEASVGTAPAARRGRSAQRSGAESAWVDVGSDVVAAGLAGERGKVPALPRIGYAVLKWGRTHQSDDLSTAIQIA